MQYSYLLSMLVIKVSLNTKTIHQLGKGRTATLMACLLTWIGEFSSPMEALTYVAERRGISSAFIIEIITRDIIVLAPVALLLYYHQ